MQWHAPEAAEEACPGHGVEAAGGAGAAQVPAAAVAGVPVGAGVEHEAAHLAATLVTTQCGGGTWGQPRPVSEQMKLCRPMLRLHSLSWPLH